MGKGLESEGGAVAIRQGTIVDGIRHQEQDICLPSKLGFVPSFHKGA